MAATTIRTCDKQLSPAQNMPALQAIDFPKRNLEVVNGSMLLNLPQHKAIYRIPPINSRGRIFLFFSSKGGDYSREGGYSRKAII